MFDIVGGLYLSMLGACPKKIASGEKMAPLKINAVVNGHRLFGLLSGEGGTTVILDAGLGSTSGDWSKVQPAVATFSKVFSYDRAGLGQSEKAPAPRTCQDIISDLRELLLSASLHPPYILVSHSWSAINARWFANQYPDEIAGMLLIDPVHEDKYAQFEKILSAEQASRMWTSVKDQAKNDENIDRITSIEQVHGKQTLFDFPLIILTRLPDSDELNKIETNLQAEYLKLSTHSRQVFSKYDDHFIQISEPELVIDSIRQVLVAIRQKANI
jgi:pimeloyl-ACP methyl ester carboxylesterase